MSSVATLNRTMKNCEETEKSYNIKSGPFSKQQKALKPSLLEKFVSALAA